jgi:hypothetical protein
MKYLLIIILIGYSFHANSQSITEATPNTKKDSTDLVENTNFDKTASVITSGSGKTQEEAKQIALRSSIEQTIGTFISAKTEINNDQIISDEITSVASGSIQSYEILNASQLPDGNWGVTLKVVVSITKLMSFVEAKGVSIEIKGGLFALKIKQLILNEEAEVKALYKMLSILHEPLQTAFDYSIKSGEPKSVDSESKNWIVPLTISAIANTNLDICANYCLKTLKALSLTTDEVESYKTLNKKFYTVNFNYNGANDVFYLRKQNSINILYTLTSQWEFYNSLFTVQSGMDELNGIADFHDSSNWDYKNGIIINFSTIGQVAATYSLEDKRTLTQIEQMTGYKVKPRGIISRFKYGGFIINEENGHGLVMSVIDLYYKYDASVSMVLASNNLRNTLSNKLNINGYDDWRVPNKSEFEKIQNLYKLGLGGLNGIYIGNTMNQNEYYDYIYFDEYYHFRQMSSSYKEDYTNTKVLRAVRTF